MSEGKYTCCSTCFKCDRGIVVSYVDDNFETEQNATFLGRLGTRKFSFCPYCGAKQTGFAPYDWDQEMDLSIEDDIDDEEEHDEGESWWPDAEGATLIDEDEEEDDDDSWDESEKDAFVCPSCGKKTWLNPKGCNRIFCFYCGKETVKES